MKKNLQILHFEDDDLDAQIIKNILKEEGIECSITRASCKKEYFSKIHQNDYDIILADNSLPDYDGISALKYAREHKPKIPFIFVSGTIGEERAVEALRYGAKDYVLKQHLNKLAPAIRRIINEIEIEQASKESEEKYRSFFENSMDAILLTIPNGNILSANPATCMMFGYSEEELIKVGRSGIIDMTDHQLSDFLSVRKLKGKAQGELTFNRKDGTCFSGEVSSAIFKDHEGFERTSMIIRDITERKRVEETLRENHERYKKSQKIGGVGSWEYDIENDSFWGSDEAKRIYGFNSETDNFSAEDVLKCVIERDRVNQALIDIIEKNEPYNIVFDIIPSNSSEKKTINLIAELSRDENGNHLKVTGVLQDITDRKRAEEALRKSEEKFKSIFEGSNDAIMLLNEKGFFDCNPQTYKMFGINSKEEFIKLNPSELSPPNQLDGKNSFESSNEKIRTAYQQGINRFNWIHRRFNGEDFPAEVLLSVFNLGSEQVLQATVRDISERKRAEEEITMLAYSLKSINECVSITDMENKILFVNASFLKTYGYNENELVGKNITIVRLPNTTPDLVKEILPATIHGGWQGELLNKRKDGSKFHIYLSTTMIKDKDDKSLGLIGVATDITELKRAEEELIKAKEKAEQSDKLKSEFLAQMSHEIRTPLNAIVGNVDYLNESFGQKMDSDAHDCFDGINLASKRIIRTIDLILNVAELQTSGYKPRFVKVDLNSEILNKLNQEHQLSAKQKGIEFIYTCKEKDTKVIADEYSITQIFANLIDNAIKYTKKGKVEILLGKNSTGNIMVEIKDTGIGMSKEFLPKLFEPFVQEVRGFSRTYDGNGLGLALVKKYCEINNASIEVESEKNVGSTFRVIVNNKN